MYSFVIAIILFLTGFWLMKSEAHKNPPLHSMWGLFAAVLCLLMGVAVSLVWLISII